VISWPIRIDVEMLNDRERPDRYIDDGDEHDEDAMVDHRVTMLAAQSYILILMMMKQVKEYELVIGQISSYSTMMAVSMTVLSLIQTKTTMESTAENSNYYDHYFLCRHFRYKAAKVDQFCCVKYVKSTILMVH
jgi:hypothetical protein